MSLYDDMAADVAAIPTSQKPQSKPLSLAEQMAQDSGMYAAQSPQKTQPESGSFIDNLRVGIGHGMVSTAQNVKQGFDRFANTVEQSLSGTIVGNAMKRVSDKLGLPTAAEVLQNTNQAIADRHKYGDPILQTSGGNIGNSIGQFASALPTVFVPGANTYTGAALLGGATGLAATEGDLAERAKGAAYGTVGGLLGKGAGDLIGAGASKLSDLIKNSSAARQAANAPRDALINLASQHGYKLPPQDVNPGMLNAALEGLSGKIKTSQAASQANQTVTNNLAKKALGVPQDMPLNGDTIQAIRQQAGNAYNTIRNTGTVQATPEYAAAIDNIMNQANGQAKSFPGLKNDEISNVLSTLKQPSFEAGDAVDATRFLRNLADKSYNSGDKATGSAYKQASNALEDALDQHLQGLGNPDALAQFRNARETIAKTYSVEKALNSSTGNVDAGKLAAQLQKGKPLSGELKDIATIASAFPKATQALKQNYNPMSPLDYAAGLAGFASNPMASTAVFARPALRTALLSSPMQSMNAKLATSYAADALPKFIEPLVSGIPLSQLLRVGGTVGAVQAAQK